MSLSLHKLTLVQGLIDTFKAIFGSHGAGEAAVYILGIGALYTYFTNMTTWSMGANRAVAEAATDGELPSFFAREDPRRGTPVVAFLITGAISTVVLLIAAVFIKSQDSLYYAIFAASSVVFLLPYLLMFPAAVVLRIKDPDTVAAVPHPGWHQGRCRARRSRDVRHRRHGAVLHVAGDPAPAGRLVLYRATARNRCRCADHR